ncbi:MAG: diacylglycerol kinase family protein, partial [Actinomycetota bacterium]
MALAGIVVVANPSAGDGKAGRLIGRVAKILSEIGIDHEIRVSGSAAEMEQLAREAAQQGAAIVAALGGD